MSSLNNLKARQIKAARALADWSQEELAEHSGLSVATIRKIEVDHMSPRGRTMQAIRQAFEDNGLEFIEPDGVRRRPDDIMIYQGEDGFRAFCDDIYQVAQKKGGEFVMATESEEYSHEILGDYHSERMSQLKDSVKVKCLITKNIDKIYYSDYCTHRYLPKGYIECVPFYIYGDKYAIIIFKTETGPRVTVFQSPTIAAEYRKMFASMWDKAIPLSEKTNKTSTKIATKSHKR